jgi:hypothetical protein
MQLGVERAGLTPLNGCRRCGHDFTSLEYFDRHKPGSCLDPFPSATSRTLMDVGSVPVVPPEQAV